MSKQLLIAVILTTGMMGCAAFSEYQTVHSRNHFIEIKQKGRFDCGLAAMIAVMNYWNVDVSLHEAKQSIGPSPKGGYRLYQLKEYAKKKELYAFVLKGNIESLMHHTSLGRPCIIVYQRRKARNHSVVVLKVHNSFSGQVLLNIMDPANGKVRTVSAESLTEKWQSLGSPILLIAKANSKTNESLNKKENNNE